MQCTSPTRIYVLNEKSGLEEPLYVPCGQCSACRIAKKREWTIRLLHECGYWDDVVFITLTYDEEKLPLDRGLHKDHLQGFFKRFRRFIEPRTVKFFACGEYGDRFGRPHYHAIIFGASALDKDSVAKAWPNGFVCVEPVTIYRLQYVCGYVQKKLTKKYAKKVYGDLQPPFQLQSRGLGLAYFLENMDRLCDSMSCKTWTGAKFALPRYYRKKAGSSISTESLKQRSMEERVRLLARHGITVPESLAGDSLFLDLVYRSQLRDKDSSLRQSQAVAEKFLQQKLEQILSKRGK